MNEQLSKFLKKLKEDEIKEIFTPISEEQSTFSTPIILEEEEIIEDENGVEHKNNIKVSAILNGRISRTCYVLYAKFQYHAWVTLDGRPYTVDLISATMNSGNGNFTKTVKNTSSLKKLDEVYEYGNACKSARMIIRAIKGNASARGEVKLK